MNAKTKNTKNNPVMIEERLVEALIGTLAAMHQSLNMDDYDSGIYGEAWEMIKSNRVEIFKELDEYEKSQQTANGRTKK